MLIVDLHLKITCLIHAFDNLLDKTEEYFINHGHRQDYGGRPQTIKHGEGRVAIVVVGCGVIHKFYTSYWQAFSAGKWSG